MGKTYVHYAWEKGAKHFAETAKNNYESRSSSWIPSQNKQFPEKNNENLSTKPSGLIAIKNYFDTTFNKRLAKSSKKNLSRYVKKIAKNNNYKNQNFFQTLSKRQK